MAEITVRTGSVYVPFERNAQIAVDNVLNGRPLFEGQLPSVDVPDQNGLPEWIVLRVDHGR